jgi:Asp-tRNA(Asn)/Glu-tRNA(Gln) amidotransferase A subunit family amidase
MRIMTDNILQMDASRIAELIADGELSPVEVMKAHLDRIAEVNPKVNAIVTMADGALTLLKKPRQRSSRRLDWALSMAFRSRSRMESTRRAC